LPHLEIVRHDPAGSQPKRWTFHGAWIRVPAYGDLEGGNAENGTEMPTICRRCRTA